MDRLAAYRTKLDKLLAEHAHARRVARDEETALAGARDKLDDALQAQKLGQGVAEFVQQTAHKRIASVVSRCLEAVFGDDAYQFRIDFRQARGKTEARLVFERDGLVLEDPLNEGGGGQIDVASLALRLVGIVLARPPMRRLLVLDEPMKHVNGEEYQARVGGMLKALAKEFGVQLILVSDDDWLKQIGTLIELD